MPPIEFLTIAPSLRRPLPAKAAPPKGKKIILNSKREQSPANEERMRSERLCVIEWEV